MFSHEIIGKRKGGRLEEDLLLILSFSYTNFPEDKTRENKSCLWVLYALLASSSIHFLVKHLLSFSLVDHLTIDEPKGASFTTSHQRFMSTIHRGYKAATFTFL